LKDIPSSVPVSRAFSLDTAVHLGFRKRYFNWMALPDRWVTWVFGGVPAGLRLIAKHKPKIIWSTYPIATAHLVAYILHRITGIPWVADFRDPMVEIDPVTKQQWPIDPRVRRARLWIERFTLRHCTRAVFASPGSRRIYAERYPEVPPEHLALIQNGYDEENFKDAEGLKHPAASKSERLTLLHSGVLYPSPDRHPGAFFSALGNLRRSGHISPLNLKVILRASSYEDGYRELIRKEGIDEIVSLEPGIPYRQALAEMLSVDGLLIFQGHDSNPAIPAKLYEYFRARRPIFAMADSAGDTAGELRAAGIGSIVPLDSAEQIEHGLLDFLSDVRAGRARVLSDAEIARHSRASKTVELVRLLNDIVEQPAEKK
jgi:glycosyltransferase involved in cell wall biosynthesis